ncbi:MAG: nucleotidyl transferase AbiEii/AbiGii toxin family protein [Gemmataceae bacterium]
MKLFEHPDFDQAIIRATEHFRSRGLRESFIEKDYYVTEVLRIIAKHAADKIIFKGGTSLSKGWNLIERFSEDIDLFLDPMAFQPPLGKNGIDRELKRIREEIEKHPGLTFLRQQSKTIGGFGRNDRFEYKQNFAGTGEIRNHVFVEAGAASGREPTESIRLSSYISQFLQETSGTLGAEDEGSFDMRLLHFRRTFVEKMFTIHAKVEAFKAGGSPIGTYARHYYDLYCLADCPEVLQMLKSQEYSEIREDYDRVSRKHFPAGYVPPTSMSFAQSEALFPPTGLRAILAPEFERQCKVLCFGTIPRWDEFQMRMEKLRLHL